nr:MAG TPA: hypothetical protein [Caudoviricetes sp.]
MLEGFKLDVTSIDLEVKLCAIYLMSLTASKPN